MTKETTGANKLDVQDDHAPSKIGPGTANKSKDREKKSQLEGPAAYAPHDKSEKSNCRRTGIVASKPSAAPR